MNKQAVVKVLNELNDIAFERCGGDTPYILVKDREDVRHRLRDVGITDEQVDKVAEKGEWIDLLNLAFENHIADDYYKGKFVVWNPLIDDELWQRASNGEGTSSDAERLLRAFGKGKLFYGLTEQEKNLINFLRYQHGIIYARNHLELTDGVATTKITSEDAETIDLFSQVLNWEDDEYINYLRNREYDTFCTL